ncbi:MAG: type II toxin-antitoxin system VapB family antitoxin [Candidatus Sericytochromatia bacterium]|nr:type II toxin-antitoxin system VapB family antitoxin [Candidatus Sericytochromatia bacterium]
MRTNIVIDPELMAEAMRLGGFKTKKETVEQGLKALIQLRQQAQIRAWRGRLRWEGDLEALRRDDAR